MLHQTALHATHPALGATLVDFGGWDMPLWYPTGAVKEHLAVIQAAGLFDIGHMAGLLVSGPDALEMLQWTFTKDLSLSGPRAAYGAFLDAEGGVDLNLCERFHHAADALLDELDPTYGVPYTLNCSSLGLDWPIKTDRDFQRRLHEKVEVKLFAPQDGKKEYVGELTAFDENTFTIFTEKGEVTFERAKAAKVTLYIKV